MLKKLQAVELTGKNPGQVKVIASVLVKAQGRLKGLPAGKGVGKKAIGDVNKALKSAKGDLEKALAAQVGTSLRDLENAFEGVAKWGYFVETRLGDALVLIKNVQFSSGPDVTAPGPQVVAFGPDTTTRWLQELNAIEKAGANCRKEYNDWAKAVKSAARDQGSIKKVIGVSKNLGSSKKSIKRLEELENTYKKSCDRLDNNVKSRMVLLKSMSIV